MQAMSESGAAGSTPDAGGAERPRAPGRVSVDLAAYPDLVVVMLGFRVSTWRGIRALLRIGRGLDTIRRARPDGLLAQDTCLFGLNHVGIRQYWRDFDSLEAFTRSDPHRTWWRDFSRDPAGSGFWHEAYRRSGGMEAVYIGMPAPVGLATFAAARAPVGPFASSRQRIAA